jgi:LPS export ABC transporter protein LptC
MQKVQATADAFELSREAGTGVKMYYSENGATMMELTAPVANRYETNDPYIEFPQGVLIEMRDEQGNPTGMLRSKYAITYENKDRTIFRDSVFVRNERDEQLFTEELLLDEGQDRIHSDRFVRIITPQDTLMGYGLESNQSFTKYRILKPRGKVNVDEPVTGE